MTFNKWWRKYGVAVIVPCMFVSMPFSSVAVGFFTIMMMMTVPCGIKKVNKCWWLWYPRQVYFLFLGFYLMFG